MVFVSLAVTLFVPCAAFSADVAQDYSQSSNPSADGAWMYGWSSSMTSALNLYPNNGLDTPIAFWHDDNHLSLGAPCVSYNTGSSAYDTGTVHWDGNGFSMHPGPSGEYTHAVWIAPVAGDYALAATFYGWDHVGTSTDVHILKNGNAIFDGGVYGYLAAAAYSGSLSLSKGDTLDFCVGFGNGNFYYDSTGLSAKINAVPEPISSALFLLGGAALAVVRGRRKTS
jgi:hypothetical protein